MGALKALVVVMGVLIIAGLAVIVTTIVTRATHSGAITPGAALLLDEPDGTHVGETAVSNGILALTLVGGGPDRVVVVDLSNGRVVRRVSLSK